MQKQTTRQAQAACGVYTVMFTEENACVTNRSSQTLSTDDPQHEHYMVGIWRNLATTQINELSLLVTERTA
jgi:hypothetical protein